MLSLIFPGFTREVGVAVDGKSSGKTMNKFVEQIKDGLYRAVGSRATKEVFQS